jgi:hypothetical protein
MRRDTATWAVRADAVVIANTRHTFSGEPEQIIPCVSDRTPIASTASRPANRDDRDTPLSSGRDKGIKSYNDGFVKGAVARIISDTAYGSPLSPDDAGCAAMHMRSP